MKKLLLGAGAVVIAVAGFALKTLHDAGQFKELKPHAQGRCVPVSGMVGAEDITFHPGLGYAYVSSDDRRATMAGHPVPGGIYRFDPTGATPTTLLTGDFSKDFHPHGISLYVAPDGTQTLYVVNHASTGNAIERFEVGADGRLVHRQTLRDTRLVSPNDLVALDAERFYVTNDHGNPPGVKQVLEDYLQLGQGTVLYYDGQGFQTVLQGTKLANGINRSADGRTVYLTESLAGTLSLYDRDLATGALTHVHTLPLGTGPDNIELDAQGDLWIAAHPKLLDFAAHARDTTGTRRAPAQVLHLTGKGKDLVISEVFLDDGQKTSATATAALFGKHLLLGPVFDKDLLACELP
ncbi:SMP-30/gluconolactonase/LRE family protein [Myxococcus sp. K15C18031901]|uniref:SMP-30/gluconolactonase/LRE family protein n=1 Tax=Myxococcus dinghuensis TaxID=2906761 RepID=UPI0020A7477E|nr:SMP-30/gluconolactonase/LRE family protein [Myxococcus dinghuensis]MCP3102575.1 SMP-30/gluconolactonase/LRE family protein [Myxococcus dinghuensis]